MIRSFQRTLQERLEDPELPFIQVLIGPRQVGKTTAVLSIQKNLGSSNCLYASADEALAHHGNWLHEKWREAQRLGNGSYLFIDEIQKVDQWSSVVKELWDGETKERKKRDRTKVVLLGSSSLEIQNDLRETLAGRFELVYAYHWDFLESKKAFQFTLDDFLSYGGYPGSYPLTRDFPRWFSFIKESIVEAVIGKDLLSIRSVMKPALFRQTFELLCRYPAQEISYTKLLGKLQEKGNVELVKHYLSLYEGAFLFRGLEKYSTSPLKKKSSSPKILPLCPAFYSMTIGKDAAKDPEERGRLFEVAVGSKLNQLPGDLTYWRDGKYEVDFVYAEGKRLYAIEVKSGRNRSEKGLDTFCLLFPRAKKVWITEENFEAFLEDPLEFFGAS